MSQADDKLFDVRIRELNVKRGRIARKDIDRYLNDLSDDADVGEEVSVFEEESDVAEEEVENT